MTDRYTLSLIAVPPADLTRYAPTEAPTFTGTARFAGTAQLAAGSPSAPSLSFTGDTDSGLYHAGADMVALAAGGVPVLRAAAAPGQVNNLLLTAATSGGTPAIVAEGADAAIGLRLMTKGTMQDVSDVLLMNGAGRTLARFGSVTGSPSNSLLVRAQATGQPVQLYAEGGDASIDLALLPKGSAGRLRFGSVMASADAPITGYIEVKDATGTVRKLAVIA